ncbi:MAG: OmpA family protein [Saprospiraceae bacterium]
MSKSTSTLLVLLVTLAWFWFSWKWYTCWCMQSCGCEPKVEETIPATPSQGDVEMKRFPIDFKWSDATAFTNSGFETYQQSIQDGMNENNRLEIVGQYFEGEPAPDGFENMGLARAEKIKALFSPPIPDDRIILRARLIDSIENMRTAYFEASSLKWMEGERKTVEELDDRIIIRFPVNSTRKTYDPSVDEYLDKLAKRMKETGERVSLTGHTDNVGDADKNLNLGERRANAIKEILISKGVDGSLITVSSKGETQPVADNSTNEGRQDNRRVEVQLQKKQ